MKYYQNPITQQVYGYDETNPAQEALIQDVIAKGWKNVTNSWPPKPTDDKLIAECKFKAQGLLAETDWSEIPSVVDPTHTPHLANASDFVAYRVLIRSLVVNPVINPVWPTTPTAVWSN